MANKKQVARAAAETPERICLDSKREFGGICLFNGYILGKNRINKQ